MLHRLDHFSADNVTYLDGWVAWLRYMEACIEKELFRWTSGVEQGREIYSDPPPHVVRRLCAARIGSWARQGEGTVDLRNPEACRADVSLWRCFWGLGIVDDV